MSTVIEHQLRKLNSDYVRGEELAALLNMPDNARHAQVKRALAMGYLVRLRRGVYRRAGYLECEKPHPFELSQYLLWPSYVSLESALSYHGLIPEAVYTTTCVTSKRPKTFNNQFGVFDFQKLPNKNFMVGVERIEEGTHIYFVASIWKALCDYVYCYKIDWTTCKPLIESLRIELDDLPQLNKDQAKPLLEFYNHSRIDKFIKGVFSEWGV